MNIWARLSLLLIAAFLFFAGNCLMDWEKSRQLQSQLDAARSEMERLRVEHRDTLDAINSALNSREAIHGQAQTQQNILREALCSDPFAALPLPDALRRGLLWQEDGNPEIPSPSSPAQEHGNPGSLPNSDSGRHGSANR